MSPTAYLVALSETQREMLLAHIDGPVALDVSERPQTRQSLVKSELLKYSHKTGATPDRFPKFTRLTELGRMVLACMLADYAEKLIQSGMLESQFPIETSPSIIFDKINKRYGYGKIADGIGMIG